MCGFGHGERKRILREQYAPRCSGLAAKQHVSYAREHGRIAREPAAGVEAGCESANAFERNAAVRGTYAVDAAKTCRRAHRAAGVAADGEIHKLACDRCGGTAGRAARHALRRAHIDRRAIVEIFTGETERHFLGVCFAREGRACVEKALCNAGVNLGGIVRAQPIGAAETGFVAGHIEDIFQAEG